VANATPVGSANLKGKSPLPRGLAPAKGAVVFDLIYHPNPTPFLRDARRRGCKVVNGWPMLVGQAEAAFRIWTGRGFPVKTRQALLASGHAQ
jgi:shikimate dehydrogenase